MLMMSAFRSRSHDVGNRTDLAPRRAADAHAVGVHVGQSQPLAVKGGASDARDVGVQVRQSHPLAARAATDAMMLAFRSGNQPY